MDRPVALVEKTTIGEKSVVYQKLKKASKGRQWPFKASQDTEGKPSTEKHLHSLVAHERTEEIVENTFPGQLFLHTLKNKSRRKGEKTIPKRS